jgi:deoxyribonuclease V
MVGADPRGWDLTPSEAAARQRELAGRVVARSTTPLDSLRLVAGLDVSYDKTTRLCHAAIVVIDRFTMETIEETGLSEPARFPYVPGLLSFREIPPLLKALESLHTPVDAFIADGQGVAHPRRIGLAAHFGLCVEKPTVGCAKSILIGVPKGRLGIRRGSRAPLVDPKTGEELGAVVRTRHGVTPVYVSVGHRISLDDAVALVLACAPRYRLTEPIRRAHALSNRLRREKIDTR